MENEQKVFDFEKTIKPIFTWVGTICAVLLFIVYIISGIILMNGVDQPLGTQQVIMYAILNGVMTLLILISLAFQGQDFAKSLPWVKKIQEELNNLKPKKQKKIHSMAFYWCTEIPKKVILKGGWAWFSTLAVTTIFIQGNGDMSLIWMILMNGIMAFGTGLLACSKTYDYYINNQVPLMQKQINEMKGEDPKENENEQSIS